MAINKEKKELEDFIFRSTGMLDLNLSQAAKFTGHDRQVLKEKFMKDGILMKRVGKQKVITVPALAGWMLQHRVAANDTRTEDEIRNGCRHH